MFHSRSNLKRRYCHPMRLLRVSLQVFLHSFCQVFFHVFISVLESLITMQRDGFNVKCFQTFQT